MATGVNTQNVFIRPFINEVKINAKSHYQTIDYHVNKAQNSDGRSKVLIMRGASEPVSLSGHEDQYLEYLTHWVNSREGFGKANIEEVRPITSSNGNLLEIVPKKSAGQDDIIRAMQGHGFPMKTKSCNESVEQFGHRVYGEIEKKEGGKYYSGIYIRDITDPLQSHLARDVQFPHTFLIPVTPESENMHGISGKMAYFGGVGSVTAFHLEDGELSSMNMVFTARELEKPAKFWLFMDESSTEKLYSLPSEKLKQLFGKRITSGCQFFHKEKNYHISAKCFASLDIKFHAVLQYPGDLIWDGGGIPHCVINLQANGAWAQNVGTVVDFHAEPRFFCDCEGKQRQARDDLISPEKRAELLKPGGAEKILGLMKCNDCPDDKFFPSTVELENHRFRDHQYAVLCPTCGQEIRSNRTYRRHLTDCGHDGPKKELGDKDKAN